MIVVAIIGLLATIPVPSYVKARGEAQKVSCINNLQEIDGAIQTWAFEMRKDGEQAVTFSDIRGYLRNSVACPAGGSSFAHSYTITTVDAKRIVSENLKLINCRSEPPSYATEAPSQPPARLHPHRSGGL